MGSANAGFQHAAAPDRQLGFLCHVVYGDRLTETAYPSNFDIDNAACAKFHRRPRVPTAMDCLIETDGGLDLPLQLCVEIEIVMPQWLFDHQQVELVESFQKVNLFQRVCGVGVAAENNFRPSSANLLKHFHVPAWFAFHLNAPITGFHFRLDLFQELLV